MLVDADFYNISDWAVVGHEMLHAAGAWHVAEEGSVLYPFLEAVSAVGLTQREANQLEYAFCLTPGQSLAPFGQPADRTPAAPIAIMAASDSAPRLFTLVTTADGRTVRQAGVPDNLRNIPQVQAFLQKAANGSGGMLWDQIGQ